jgi:hypothetical protein
MITRGGKHTGKTVSEVDENKLPIPGRCDKSKQLVKKESEG